jgi:nucleoid-associated protein YgaU
MAESQKGKNIFQQAVDAVSNRDEKAAVEAAMKRAQELEKQIQHVEQKAAQAEQRAAQTAQKLAESERKVAALQTDLTKARSELETTRTSLTAAQARTVEAERKLNHLNVELHKYMSAAQSERLAEAAAAAEQAKIITEHTLTADETLSHMALKYYGHATEPYWRVIYEANKEIIGENPSRVRPGMAIKIPVLPEELKK